MKNKRLISLIVIVAMLISQTQTVHALKWPDFVDDVVDWTNGAAEDVVDWTDGAAEDVVDWTNGAVEDTVDWTKGAGKDVYKWTNGAIEDVGDWSEQAFDDTYGWIEGAAEDVSNWTENAYEDAYGWTKNAIEDVSNFVSPSGKVYSKREMLPKFEADLSKASNLLTNKQNFIYKKNVSTKKLPDSVEENLRKALRHDVGVSKYWTEWIIDEVSEAGVPDVGSYIVDLLPYSALYDDSLSEIINDAISDAALEDINPLEDEISPKDEVKSMEFSYKTYLNKPYNTILLTGIGYGDRDKVDIIIKSKGKEYKAKPVNLNDNEIAFLANVPNKGEIEVIYRNKFDSVLPEDPALDVANEIKDVINDLSPWGSPISNKTRDVIKNKLNDSAKFYVEYVETDKKGNRKKEIEEIDFKDLLKNGDAGEISKIAFDVVYKIPVIGNVLKPIFKVTDAEDGFAKVVRKIIGQKVVKSYFKLENGRIYVLGYDKAEEMVFKFDQNLKKSFPIREYLDQLSGLDKNKYIKKLNTLDVESDKYFDKLSNLDDEKDFDTPPALHLETNGKNVEGSSFRVFGKEEVKTANFDGIFTLNSNAYNNDLETDTHPLALISEDNTLIKVPTQSVYSAKIKVNKVHKDGGNSGIIFGVTDYSTNKYVTGYYVGVQPKRQQIVTGKNTGDKWQSYKDIKVPSHIDLNEELTLTVIVKSEGRYSYMHCYINGEKIGDSIIVTERIPDSGYVGVREYEADMDVVDFKTIALEKGDISQPLALKVETENGLIMAKDFAVYGVQQTSSKYDGTLSIYANGTINAYDQGNKVPAGKSPVALVSDNMNPLQIPIESVYSARIRIKSTSSKVGNGGIILGASKPNSFGEIQPLGKGYFIGIAPKTRMIYTCEFEDIISMSSLSRIKTKGIKDIKIPSYVDLSKELNLTVAVRNKGRFAFLYVYINGEQIGSSIRLNEKLTGTAYAGVRAYDCKMDVLGFKTVKVDQEDTSVSQALKSEVVGKIVDSPQLLSYGASRKVVSDFDGVFSIYSNKNLNEYDNGQKTPAGDGPMALVIEPGTTRPLMVSNKSMYSANFTIKRVTHDSGNAGLAFGVSSARPGNDQYDGYYVGVYPNKNEVAFGRMNYGWNRMKTMKVPDFINLNQQINLAVVVEGRFAHVFVDNYQIGSVDLGRELSGAGSAGVRTWKAEMDLFDFKTIEID